MPSSSKSTELTAPSRDRGSNDNPSTTKSCLRWLGLLALSLSIPMPIALAQSSSSTLSGTVADPSTAVIPGSDISLANQATNDVRRTTSNGSGDFTFVGLSAGSYTLSVNHTGFNQYKAIDLTLNAGDRKTIQVVLSIGSSNETVTVSGSEQPLVSTESSVSAVIASKFIQQLPLNGRSFQDLILLIPGTNTNSPQQYSQNNGQSGQLSVNGQGYQSNGYTIDGVSANVSAGNTGGFTSLALGGGLPSATALGTTQSLVSVDALQEFRVETSSYAAEYGRYPGAQINFVTKAGTKSLHGTVYDYLRNTIFDANDYFNKFNSPVIGRQALHQNDFGGTIGGPVFIPKLYTKRDRTFFFFNYEGLRLTQPIASGLAYVPTSAVRASAGNTPLGAALNAFPLTNAPAGSSNADLGDGLAVYTAGYTSPSSIDSESIRLDHSFSDTEKIFYRFSNTPSNNLAPYLAGEEATQQNNRTNTLGLTSVISGSSTNEFRFNFTSNVGTQASKYVQQPGAVTTNLLEDLGYPGTLPAYYVGVSLIFTQTSSISSYKGTNSARGLNITDAFTLSKGRHSLKLGIDYRRLTSTNVAESPNVGYDFYSQGGVAKNAFDYAYVYSFASSYPAYINFSSFAEDEWEVTSRLHLSYGLRWDLNPSPTSRRGPLPYSYVNVYSPANLDLAPPSTPIYQTQYYNFAPRGGFSYQAYNRPGHETIIRAATGLFYDTISDEYDILSNFVGPGFAQGASYCPESYCTTQLSSYALPVPIQDRNPVIVNPPVPPYGSFTAYPFAPHLALPYSVQFSSAVQQNFSGHDAMTVSYVGSLGRKLIGSNTSYINAVNPNFNYVLTASNRLRSHYNALQLQFQHQQSHGLSFFGAYTWAHSIGELQTNSYLPYVTANSNGDVRSSGNLAASWDIPAHLNNGALKALAQGWGTDLRFVVRTGFPLSLTGPQGAAAVSGGSNISTALNVVSGMPLYLYGSSIPGRRRLNPAAFVPAAPGVNGTYAQNSLHGFGENQVNLTLRRTFPIHESVNLQLRADTFNIFNHANFGTIDTTLGDVTFGQATNMLASGLGGLASQYQGGGPRSMQLALKLLF